MLKCTLLEAWSAWPEIEAPASIGVNTVYKLPYIILWVLPKISHNLTIHAEVFYPHWYTLAALKKLLILRAHACTNIQTTTAIPCRHILPWVPEVPPFLPNDVTNWPFVVSRDIQLSYIRWCRWASLIPASIPLIYSFLNKQLVVGVGYRAGGWKFSELATPTFN